MTLCAIWKQGDEIHFASDSRLTLARNSYADVAIKVLSVPFNIYSPSKQEGAKELMCNGELGMCFAGSAVNSLFLKETIIEVLKNLQYAPGYTDLRMEKIAKVIFKAYKIISKKICETALAERGIAEIFIAGLCPHDGKIKVFKFETDLNNNHKYSEVLLNSGDYILSGSGRKIAQKYLDEKKTPIGSLALLNALKSTIENNDSPDVGGPIQYGTFKEGNFITYGIVEYEKGESVHYYRAALDLNSNEFAEEYDDFILSYQYIDPFNTFNKNEGF